MGKTALITGGTRGIGLGIARSLAKEKWNLVLNGIREENVVQPVLEEFKAKGINAIYVRGNISDREQRNGIVNRVKDQFGHLNVLVNNAGMAPRVRKDVLETTEESFEDVLKTNLQGPYFLTQQVANWMASLKKTDPDFRSYIINITSISSTVASVNRGEYCISKAGLSMMTQLFAVRLGEFEIPVYEIRPGIVKTDMTAGVKQKYDELIENGLCVQPRWGMPEDVGKVVASLVRGDLQYSTGQVIFVDGGMTIPRL